MKDKSGRTLNIGDLVVCFRNKQKLESLEYAIVISDGKVFNGSMNYTVGNYSYKCAMTPEEETVKSSLTEMYNQKSRSKMQQKANAKLAKEVGSLVKKDKGLMIYLGKVRCNVYNDDILDIEKSLETNLYLHLVKGVTSFNTDLIQNNVLNLLDMNNISINNYYKYSNKCEWNYNGGLITYQSMISSCDNYLGKVELLNWNKGDKFVVNTKGYSCDGIKLEFIRLK